MPMFNYYLTLALRSLKRNVVLTLLMIVAIGVGIGASMTVLTVLRSMSADPIPSKSSQLFVPMIDNWGENQPNASDWDDRDLLSYRDALAWSQARKGFRQTAIYSTYLSVTPQSASSVPFNAVGRAAQADFFAMFAVPFRAGGGWSRDDDEARANVVVIGSKLADRVFPQGDALGKTITLEQRDYRVVGVIGDWEPAPRYYDVTGGGYSQTEDVFVPFSTAIERQMPLYGNNSCHNA